MIKQLGVGTYGSVSLSEEIETGKQVAVKMARGTTSVSLLKNEADILKHVESEYFPKFVSFNMDLLLNRGYLVMEYIEGKSLDEFWAGENCVSEEQAYDLLNQIIEAVSYLHSKGVVHRDIKPQNIIITPDLKIKLIDFNISKMSTSLAEHKSDKPTCKFYGKFFTQISSPLFAAPELSSVDYYTESIDIWGIGIIYLILLCGMNVFKLRITSKLDKENIIESLKDNLNEYSRDTKSLLSQLLAADANDRPCISQLQSMVAK